MSQLEDTNTSAGGDACSEWMKEWDAWPATWYLSTPCNCDGRPVWEPPILDYSEYIDDEYEKMRKAMLEYTGGDVARTTDIMDAYTGIWLLVEYSDWAEDNAKSAVDSESKKFFEGLSEEVGRDGQGVFDEWEGFDGGLIYRKNEDETYFVDAFNAEDKVDVDVSDNVSDGSRSTSTHDKNDIPSTTSMTQPDLKTEFNRISSPTDEAEELAWLDSLDASASTTSPPLLNPTLPHNNKPLALPLALRLFSLHSSSHQTPNHTEDTHIDHEEEDDLD